MTSVRKNLGKAATTLGKAARSVRESLQSIKLPKIFNRRARAEIVADALQSLEDGIVKAEPQATASGKIAVVSRQSSSVKQNALDSSESLVQSSEVEVAASEAPEEAKFHMNALYEEKKGKNALFGTSAKVPQDTRREPYRHSPKVQSASQNGTDFVSVATVGTDTAAEQEKRDWETRLDRIKGRIVEADIPAEHEQQERDAMMDRIQAAVETKAKARAARNDEIIASLKGAGEKVWDLRVYGAADGLKGRHRGVAPAGEVSGGTSKLNVTQPVSNAMLESTIDELDPYKLTAQEQQERDAMMLRIQAKLDQASKSVQA